MNQPEVIRWVVYDMYRGTYTVSYQNGRTVTFRGLSTVPETVLTFIQNNRAYAYTGKYGTYYES